MISAIYLLSSFLKEMFFRVKSLKALNQIREKNKKTILNRIHQYEFYKNKSIQGWDDLPIIDKKIVTAQVPTQESALD